jgi:tetratricopeptide (TPR) repeat protein
LSDSSPKHIYEALAKTAADPQEPPRRQKSARVRVSPGGYLAAAALLTFASLVLLRTHRDLAALILIAGTWCGTPILIWIDRLDFDGRVISRAGLPALISRFLRGRVPRIKLEDIERVDVATLRTLRRGGSVRYRYRVEIMGGQAPFAFTSGGRRFREMVGTLLPQISDHKLDARARELRDHLISKKEVRLEAKQLGIASASVLEETAEAAGKRPSQNRTSSDAEVSREDRDRAQMLRKAANDLRVAGRLREAAEGFRRALLSTPRDPWLIYELGRLLRSQASALSDARLLGRACAALRLASMRGAGDARLLERVAESFLEYGDPVHAAKTFRRALEIDENSFRAQIGLAEVALNEGKLAHVIHHYRDAARIALDKADARMARREGDYYARLNDDENYLATELRRMNWLEHANRIQSLAARVSFASLLVALVGPSLDPRVSGIGWAVASSSILAWSGALITRKFLSSRGRFLLTDS